MNESRSVEDGATLFNEPHLGFLFWDSLELANTASLCSSTANTSASAAKDYVKVHTENTSWGIVFDAEIDVFVDTKAEVAYYNN